MSDWAPVATGSLNFRGVLNREFESFGVVLWGAESNHMVAFVPRNFTLETESTTILAGMPLSLWYQHVTKKPRQLSLSGLSANQMGLLSSLFSDWLPERNPLRNHRTFPSCAAISDVAYRRVQRGSPVGCQSIACEIPPPLLDLKHQLTLAPKQAFTITAARCIIDRRGITLSYTPRRKLFVIRQDEGIFVADGPGCSWAIAYVGNTDWRTLNG